MTSAWPANLLSERLSAHGLLGRDAVDAVDVASRLCAVQAQEYASALWAIGLRMRGGGPLDIERAADEGRILRTHVLRPTWHFVAQADIRWMLALTSPRVHRLNAAGYRELELDAMTLRTARRTIVKALEARSALTRAELSLALAAKGVAASGRRLAYLVMHEELDGVICSGPRRGSQHTYALVAERAPLAVTLPRDDALALLFRRYLDGHGPATLHDFAWWSGLTLADARRALALLGSAVTVLDDGRQGARTYVALAPATPDATRGARATRRTRPAPRAWLLPNFDEYLVAYRDRSPTSGDAPPLAALTNTVVIDGRRAGTWQRDIGARVVAIDVTLERDISPAEHRAVTRALGDYGAFLGLEVMLSTQAPQPAPPRRRPAAGGGRATRR